jgi:hypothetical protein
MFYPLCWPCISPFVFILTTAEKQNNPKKTAATVFPGRADLPALATLPASHQPVFI